MKKLKILFTLLICFIACMASGDVIYLKDGSIYLGDIKNVTSEGILVNTFGIVQTIPNSDILKSEKELANLSPKKVVVELKDESNLKGKVNNYDDEIGVFIGTDFGTITIPSAAIRRLVDVEFMNRIMGYNSAVGIQFGVAMPSGSQKNNFNNGYYVQGYFEHSIMFVKELFLGIDIDYRNLVNAETSDIDYDIVALQPYAAYMVNTFRKTDIPFFNNLVPFISAGGGLTFITLHDNRPGGIDKAELVSSVRISAGIDFAHFSPIDIRLKASNDIIMESSTNFTNIVITLGARLGF